LADIDVIVWRQSLCVWSWCV